MNTNLRDVLVQDIPKPTFGSLPNTQFGKTLPQTTTPNYLYNGDCEQFLTNAKLIDQKFDLVFTSPPYNLGKPYTGYSDDRNLVDYLGWQKRIITACVDRLTPTGSICWQVGNYVSKGHIVPLDLEIHHCFKELGLKLRNRIIWHFGHGLHCKHRFSGRYEVIMWYSKTDDYTFDLDAVRIPSKYPNKKHFKGPKKGTLSGNPKGKNPSDVWDIPNVKHNHIEKAEHPCQFPAALVQRFVLALTKPQDAVCDPFAGTGTTAAVAAHLKRRFFGCEIDTGYFNTACKRVDDALHGTLEFRDMNKPVFQPLTLRIDSMEYREGS